MNSIIFPVPPFPRSEPCLLQKISFVSHSRWTVIPTTWICNSDHNPNFLGKHINLPRKYLSHPFVVLPWDREIEKEIISSFLYSSWNCAKDGRRMKEERRMNILPRLHSVYLELKRQFAVYRPYSFSSHYSEGRNYRLRFLLILLINIRARFPLGIAVNQLNMIMCTCDVIPHSLSPPHSHSSTSIARISSRIERDVFCLVA